MSTGFTIYIIAQFLITCGIIFGVAHEEKVIAFERNIADKIRKKFFSKKKSTCNNFHQKQYKEMSENNLDILHPTSCFDYSYSNVA